MIVLELILLNVSENTVISTRLKNVSAQFNVFSTYISKSGQVERSDTDFAAFAEDVAGLTDIS